tara:strand:- start:1715 stop:2206 length:492 start_codon:yes stop_codon:yes gene_type:complete
MGIITAGEYTFYECNVAFHFRRDNVYSPWYVIGVYLTNPWFQDAKYPKEHRDILKAFRAEIASVTSPYIAGEIEFLDLWRAKHCSPHDVIGPVVNYRTTYGREHREFGDVLIHLFVKYVGSCSPVIFNMLTLMHKLPSYYPSLFIDGGKRVKIRKALEGAGLL